MTSLYSAVKGIIVVLQSSVTFRVMEITAGHVREISWQGCFAALLLTGALGHSGWTGCESDYISYESRGIAGSYSTREWTGITAKQSYVLIWHYPTKAFTSTLVSQSVCQLFSSLTRKRCYLSMAVYERFTVQIFSCSIQSNCCVNLVYAEKLVDNFCVIHRLHTGVQQNMEGTLQFMCKPR